MSHTHTPDLSGKQREIKFRIYIHSSKRMIDAVGFCYEGVSQIRIWYRKGEMLYNESFLIVDTDALQFTNLLDKNGKEVYEGDRIRIYWRADDDYTDENISYDEKYCYYKYGNNPICELFDPETPFEVIGNIYETN